MNPGRIYSGVETLIGGPKLSRYCFSQGQIKAIIGCSAFETYNPLKSEASLALVRLPFSLKVVYSKSYKMTKMTKPKFRRIAAQSLFYLVAGLTLFYIIFPIYWMFIVSLKPPGRLFSVEYWPREVSLINYRFLTVNESLLYGLYNSIIVGLAVLGLTLAIGSMAAYALGRLKFRGRWLIRYSILAMTAFPTIAIVGGLYLLITNPCVIWGGVCTRWQLYNTRWALIISYLILTLPLTIWFLAGYFRQLPTELEDAAYVDGASPLQTFYYVFLPLSAPGLVTTGVLSFIIAWSEFLFALTFTIDERAFTAPVALSRYGLGAGSFALAGATLLTVPVIILAFAFRRQMTSGFTGLIGLSRPDEAETTGANRLLRLGLMTTERIVLVMLGLGLLSFLSYTWSVIPYPYTVDYGEGPLLDQAVRLANFQNIYRADLSRPPFTIANYPPLYVLAQVPWLWLFGPAYWYGRLLSWLSLVAGAIFLGLTLHSLTKNYWTSALGGLSLVTVPFVAVWAPLFRIDSLALGLSLAGLWLVVRWPDRRRGLLGGALLLTAAVYTRQSYGLAAPLAAFAWLLSQRPRYRAFLLAGLLAGLGLGLFGLLNRLTGGGFFFNIVTANINEFQMDLLNDYVEEVGLRMPGLLLVGGLVILIGGWFRPRGWWLVVPYLIGGLLSALTIGKIGSNVNYLLELSAGLSLATGLAAAWLVRRPILYHGLMLLLALQIFLFLPGTLNQWFIEQRVENPGEQAELLAIIEATPGPVLTDEQMGLLPLTGRSIYLQPFELTQLANEGVWDQTPLLEAIRRQEFGAIMIFEVRGVDLVEERWTPEMLAQVRRAYRPTARIGDDFAYVAVYRPRE